MRIKIEESINKNCNVIFSFLLFSLLDVKIIRYAEFFLYSGKIIA